MTVTLTPFPLQTTSNEKFQLRIGIKKYVKPMIKYETKESYPFIGTYFPLGEACIALTHKEADDALIS
jgi:hypothetical protein